MVYAMSPITFDPGLLAPLMFVFFGAVVAVLVEAVIPRSFRRSCQLVLTSLAIVAAIIFTWLNWSKKIFKLTGEGTITLDTPTYLSWSILLVFGLLSTWMFAERRVNGGRSAFTAMASVPPESPREHAGEKLGREHTEVFPLLLFSLTGMMVLAAANDLLVMFVALEVFSLPLYLLVGLARRRRFLSQEASIKYFLLGALSSALFLFGVALIFGYSGGFSLAGVDAMIIADTQNRTLLYAGMTLIGVGLLFKMGAVPFHAWVPDVYQGSPSAVTGFMAICTKTAAVIGLSRVFFVAFGAMRWDWQILFGIIATITILFGAILTVTQTNVKRMLAWSSITHAGFILVGIAGAFVGADGQLGSMPAVMFYLIAYGLSTVGVFAILQMVQLNGFEANELKNWSGLARKNPVIAAAMAIFLLSFAGIPLTAGFIGKLEVFLAAWRGDLGWLVIVAIVGSIIAAFAYFRVILAMFFTEPADETEVEVCSPLLSTVIAVGLIGTILLGLLPGLVTDLAVQVPGFLR